MLKFKLKKDEHDALPDAIKAEYKANAAGDEFQLDTDVAFEDVTPLKNALTSEKKHRKEATEKVTALEGSIASMTEEVETLKTRAKPAGDLEKSWQEKLTKREKELNVQIEQRTGQLRKLLVDEVASGMANEISISPDLILPHILKRLAIEEQDGKFLTRVLDGEGKASALSANELKAELLADTRFAPIVKASNASGGGASGGNGNPPAGGGKDFSKMSEGEKVKLYNSNPTEFNRLAEAAKK